MHGHSCRRFSSRTHIINVDHDPCRLLNYVQMLLHLGSVSLPSTSTYWNLPQTAQSGNTRPTQKAQEGQDKAIRLVE